jgi:hypothetical protein
MNLADFRKKTKPKYATNIRMDMKIIANNS